MPNFHINNPANTIVYTYCKMRKLFKHVFHNFNEFISVYLQL